MLVKLACVIEIVAIVAALFRINGRKFKIDFSMMCIVLISIFIQETLIVLGLQQVNTVVFGVVFYCFCKIRFGKSFARTLGNVVCVYIVTTICQFLAIILIYNLVPEDEAVRAVCANVVVLLFNVLIFPQSSIGAIKDNLNLKNIYTVIVLAIVGGTVILLLMQGKIFNGIRADLFVLLIPTIIVLVIIVRNWGISQKTIERMNNEKHTNIHMQQRYDDLIKDVRVRQHEFKNHLAAILSAHYTYKTYEQLVDAQKGYCNKLMQENKYNNLLLIDNNIVAGFLYEKFKQIEDEKIYFEYQVKARLENVPIPTYHLIEILGILIDNAVEAIRDMEEREIYVNFDQDDISTCFTIRNRNNYVSYAEIEQWFELDKTSKGIGRGVGLYHVKQLCEEWDCNVVCENIAIENKNWIQFKFIMKKTDNLV